MTPHQDLRTAELATRLGAVQARIASATAASGRSDTPALIVVSKFHPAADVLRLHGLGVRDLGENRDQEAAAKAAAVAASGLRWHFIGQLQSNKAKSVAAYAHSVQSIDRPALVAALGKAVQARQQHSGRPALRCHVQLDLSGAYPQLPSAPPLPAGGRGGAAPSELERLAELIAGTEGLELAGLMAVAPLGVPPEAAFELLARASAELVKQHPQAKAVSAGMSHDLEAAIAAGATHLRVGSDILGPRPTVR
ncbi:YggS family pyridoxal phosphate-dependent enzyme [Specibacter sp. NPDC057265]|uniref:YggS family pyridoxal phosphate-dependent enzyme n=1 Tax=Specibacter sp. NPDC057265 TaxID=3346075 RepID=UPI003640B75F